MSADFKQPIAIDDLFYLKLYFGWSQNTVGFGQTSIYRDKRDDKQVIIADTECMGREWLRRALHALADKIADEAVIE